MHISAYFGSALRRFGNVVEIEQAALTINMIPSSEFESIEEGRTTDLDEVGISMVGTLIASPAKVSVHQSIVYGLDRTGGDPVAWGHLVGRRTETCHRFDYWALAELKHSHHLIQFVKSTLLRNFRQQTPYNRSHFSQNLKAAPNRWQWYQL
jgi:hypothetical protein